MTQCTVCGLVSDRIGECPLCAERAARQQVERQRDEVMRDNAILRDPLLNKYLAWRTRAERAELTVASMRVALEVATTHRPEDREEIRAALSSPPTALEAYVAAMEEAVAVLPEVARMDVGCWIARIDEVLAAVEAARKEWRGR